MNELIAGFLLFKVRFNETCQKFRCFNIFMEKIVSVLRDFTRSYRESNSELLLPAVCPTLPLCFAFDRINYKRWLPLYYED